MNIPLNKNTVKLRDEVAKLRADVDAGHAAERKLLESPGDADKATAALIEVRTRREIITAKLTAAGGELADALINDMRADLDARAALVQKTLAAWRKAKAAWADECRGRFTKKVEAERVKLGVQPPELVDARREYENTRKAFGEAETLLSKCDPDYFVKVSGSTPPNGTRDWPRLSAFRAALANVFPELKGIALVKPEGDIEVKPAHADPTWPKGAVFA
jgi:hypothetical protein